MERLELFGKGLDHAVHVWRERLDRPEAEKDRLYTLLSPDERERAARFRFARDRDSYIVARGRLRHILSGYLDWNPNQIRFTYSPAGKPALDKDLEPGGIQFNLAHSYRRVVYSITRNRRVGVDLEYRYARTAQTVVEGYFAPGEKVRYERLSPEARETAFFVWWTRKEAFLKALGMGLSIPLDQFEVSLAPEEPAAVCWTGWNPSEAGRWRLLDLEVAADYAGALAVEGWDWDLVYVDE
ncbi:MAG: 4'-phosphopantetheinyl transferase superfamily protein [bacterium]